MIQRSRSRHQQLIDNNNQPEVHELVDWVLPDEFPPQARLAPSRAWHTEKQMFPPT
jgi:hypothetical protein